MPRELRAFIVIIGVLLLGALVLEKVNGRFWLSDFRVYWSAARGLLDGGPTYGVAFGEDTGFFKYAPVVALAFVPCAWLPFPLAAVIHFLLIGLALGICFVRIESILMRHVFGTYAPRILLRALLGLICIAVLLSRELHLGNVNLWLVVLLVLATDALLEGAAVRAGLCLGLLWLMKPYLAFTLVPLVVFRRWPSIRSALVTVAAGLVLPFVILGPEQAWHLHGQWFMAMRAHSAYLTSPDTFASIGARLIGRQLPGWSQLVLIGTSAMLLAIFCSLGKRSSPSPHPGAANEVLGIWLAMAIVPHLVITDQEHFLFSLPLILFVLAHLFRERDPLVLAMFVLAMLGYATRSSDLWGSAMENTLTQMGALGLGNIFLLFAAMFSVRRRELLRPQATIAT